MMEEEIDKMASNDSMFMNMTKENCKENCTNEVCLGPEDYEYYLSFVKVDDFEMVFVILNVIVFLTGIMGNLLVSMTDILIYIHIESIVSCIANSVTSLEQLSLVVSKQGQRSMKMAIKISKYLL
jgi:hypothetical protein